MTEEQKITFTEEDLVGIKDEIAALRNNIVAKELSIFKCEREIEEEIPAKNMQLLLNELENLREKAEKIISDYKDNDEPYLKEQMFKAELDLLKIELDIEEAAKGKELGLPILNKRAAIGNMRKGLKADRMNKKQYENVLLTAKKSLGIKG